MKVLEFITYDVWPGMDIAWRGAQSVADQTDFAILKDLVDPRAQQL